MRSYGAAEAWSAMCYGETNNSTVDFLKNQFQGFGSALTDYGQKFIQSAQNAFEHFNGSEALRFARKVVGLVNKSNDTDRIVDLRTLKELQSASVAMQRWMMANPTVRKLYHQQQCDGYSSTYHDLEPGRIGEEHYDYRRVMQGIGVEDAEGLTSWTTFGDELREGDRELIMEEQVAVLGGWSAMNVLLAIGADDPTSAEGGKL